MRRSLHLAIVFTFLIAGCQAIDSSGEATTTSLTSTTARLSTTVPSTTTATTLQPTSTTSIPDEPFGLVTPSGVNVTLLDVTADGYQVMTPCGNEVMVSNGTPIGPVDVVIDPGHGGPIDTGAVAPTGLVERDLNLDVATLAQSYLAVRGFETVLTRTGDYATPLDVRAMFADAVQAQVMVSIHHNAPTPGPSDVPGIEIFIQSDSEESKRLGGLLWDHAMAALTVFDIAWTAAPDSGVMTVLNTRGTDAYGIIRRPGTTTALIEFGYLSNRAEAELFATPQYVIAAARSLADAVEAYLTTEDAGSGFVDGRVFNPSPGVGRDVCVDPDLG